MGISFPRSRSSPTSGGSVHGGAARYSAFELPAFVWYVRACRPPAAALRAVGGIARGSADCWFRPTRGLGESALPGELRPELCRQMGLRRESYKGATPSASD